MKITDVRLSLAGSEESNDKILAYACVTFDGVFVVRDVKIIDSEHGPFVAMPSRRVRYHCPTCRTKVERGTNYCTRCGNRLGNPPPRVDHDGEPDKTYYDVAHPISSEFRRELTERVLEEWNRELDKLEGRVA